ncbi:hypothetical protein HYT25_02515 [Candidatus Pacearchaeota archaeon]|nr:hypothetical protein [Candidatus Pacearchaeota archaeon]
MNKKLPCPTSPIKIPAARKIIFTDEKKYPWKQDKKGYFLVKIQRGFLHCGFVNNRHEMKIEFVGKNPEKIIKEIAKRKLCDIEHMGYIASELIIAHECIKKNKKYAQR